MTHALDSIGIWFADYYLLSAILLLLAVIATRLVRQPVHRLAIIKSTEVMIARAGHQESRPKRRARK